MMRFGKFEIIALGLALLIAGGWWGYAYVQRMSVVGDWKGDFENNTELWNVELLRSVRIQLFRDGQAQLVIASARVINQSNASFDGKNVSSSLGHTASTRTLTGKFRVDGRYLKLEFPVKPDNIGQFEPFVVDHVRNDAFRSERAFVTVKARFSKDHGELVLRGVEDKPEVRLNNVLNNIDDEPYHNETTYIVKREYPSVPRARSAADGIDDRYAPRGISGR